jgi:hypothetical protein
MVFLIPWLLGLLLGLPCVMRLCASRHLSRNSLAAGLSSRAARKAAHSATGRAGASPLLRAAHGIFAGAPSKKASIDLGGRVQRHLHAWDRHNTSPLHRLQLCLRHRSTRRIQDFAVISIMPCGGSEDRAAPL